MSHRFVLWISHPALSGLLEPVLIDRNEQLPSFSLRTRSFDLPGLPGILCKKQRSVFSPAPAPCPPLTYVRFAPHLFDHILASLVGSPSAYRCQFLLGRARADFEFQPNGGWREWRLRRSVRFKLYEVSFLNILMSKRTLNVSVAGIIHESKQLQVDGKETKRCGGSQKAFDFGSPSSSHKITVSLL